MTPEPFVDPEASRRSHFMEILERWADRQPDEVAFSYSEGGGEEVSIRYRELWSRTRAVAHSLYKLEARGNPVLLLYPPGLDFLLGFFGTLAAGGIAVPTSIPRQNQRAKRLHSILDDSGSTLVLSTEATLARIWTKEMEAVCPKPVTVLATDTVNPEPGPKGWMPQPNPGAPALLQYTSGATSRPKGVVLSQEHLIRNCEMIAHAFDLNRSQRGVTWLPMYHDMGLIGGVLTPLLGGRPTRLMNPFSFFRNPFNWLQTISDDRANVSGGPDFAYQLCIEKITSSQLAQLDLSSWEVAFTGAEPVRPETLNKFAEKFSPAGFRKEAFLPCYGLAESTLLVSGGPKGKLTNRSVETSSMQKGKVRIVSKGSKKSTRLTSSGAPHPDVEIVIVDPENQREVKGNSIGEIWVNSPCNALGYWNDETKTRSTFQATLPGKSRPFLRTGDLGFVHEGQLFVSGRLKDLITVRGLNRYPQDIEFTCEQLTGEVRTGGVAAFSMNLLSQEALVIVAEMIRGTRSDPDATLLQIQERVANEHGLRPAAVYLVKQGTIPRTTSGKIQRQLCRRMVEEGRLKYVAGWRNEIAQEEASPVTGQGIVEPVPETSEILPGLIAIVQSRFRGRSFPIHSETNLVSDLGFDSIERLSLAHSLEEAFGGRFPDNLWAEVETVAEIAGAMEQHLKNEAVSHSTSEVSPSPPRDLEPDPSSYQFELFPEYLRLQQIGNTLSNSGFSNPYFSSHDGIASSTIEYEGGQFINFGSYDYLGLSSHPEVAAEAREAIAKFGTSASASRLVSGTRPVHDDLEAEIASFVGTEAALTFVGGFSTNETTIGHLLNDRDLVLHDRLAHSSIVQGAQLSGARRWPFDHNNCEALEHILDEVRGQYRRVLIAVEGLYSMDGDMPDLQRLVEIKERHRCLLLVDEAHSIGTVGATGRGIAEKQDVPPDRIDITMGTLSKAFASCGGFIAGSRALIEYLRYTAPGFVYSVAMPPPSAAAALASIRTLRREPARLSNLRERSDQFFSGLKSMGLEVAGREATPIVSLLTGSSANAMETAEHLRRAGIFAPPVLYPAVPESAARIRFFVTATHSEEQIQETLKALSTLKGNFEGLVNRVESD